MLPEVLSFVRSLLQSPENRVLLHCKHGKTRSGAIPVGVRAILMGEEVCDAYLAVQAARCAVEVPGGWLDAINCVLERSKHREGSTLTQVEGSTLTQVEGSTLTLVGEHAGGLDWAEAMMARCKMNGRC